MLDLTDTIVTADALNFQHQIANAIIGKGGNYVLVVKGNKGALYEDIKDYFDDKTIDSIIAKDELYIKTTEKSHSQVEIREYFLINKIHYINDNFDDFFPEIIRQLSKLV